jgi:excisionase family DNA binding protein
MSNHAATDRRLLVKVEEAADMLSVSKAAIRKWLSYGLLNPVKVGRSVRLRLSDVEQIAEKGLPSASSQLTSAS